MSYVDRGLSMWCSPVPGTILVDRNTIKQQRIREIMSALACVGAVACDIIEYQNCQTSGIVMVLVL
jgi:hypothetical protein